MPADRPTPSTPAVELAVGDGTRVLVSAGGVAPVAGDVLTALSATTAGWAAGGAGGGAPTSASYVVIGLNAGLSAERKLAVDPGLILTDGGANGNATLGPDFGTIAGKVTEGNDSRLTDDRTASGLRSATTVVAVSAAVAPSSGQVLTATGSAAATWQTPAAGGAADFGILDWLGW